MRSLKWVIRRFEVILIGLSTLHSTLFQACAFSVSALDPTTKTISVASAGCAAPEETLSVTPLYPSVGANWNDYVRTTTPTVACTGLEAGGITACVHGGERRKVMLTGIASCADLALSDSLGAFEWQCNDTAEAQPFFFSTRLKAGKGLADLMNPSNGTTFAQNSVTLTKVSTGCTLRTSPASTSWWSNTVLELPFIGTDTEATALSGEGVIYTLRTSGTTNGFNLTSNKMAVVTLPGAKLSYHNSSDTNCNAQGELNSGAGLNRALICAGDRKFLWVEGSFDGDSGGGVSATTGIFISGPVAGSISSTHRIHNSTLVDFSGEESSDSPHGIAAYYTQKLHISSVKIADLFSTTNWGGGGYSGVGLLGKDLTYSLVENLSVSYVGSWGVAFNNSAYNSLQNLTLFNARLFGILLSNTSVRNSFVGALIVGSTTGVNVGASSEFNTFHELTLANHSSSGAGAFHIAASNTTLTRSILENNQKGLGFGALSSGKVLDLAVSGTAAGSPLIDLTADSDGVEFGGTLFLDRTDCSVDPDSTSQLNSNCEFGPGPTMVDYTSASFGGSFVGVSTDSINDLEDGAGVADLISILESAWISFENQLRGWIRKGSLSLPDSNIFGALQSGDDAALFDFSLLTSETRIRSQNSVVADSSCPADVEFEDFNSNTFLLSARELVAYSATTGLPTGDFDGLCESNEKCVYSGNFGAYPGHGTVSSSSCNFSAVGSITGVTLHGYSSNGY
jgi:hypothetical protein